MYQNGFTNNDVSPSPSALPFLYSWAQLPCVRWVWHRIFPWWRRSSCRLWSRNSKRRAKLRDLDEDRGSNGGRDGARLVIECLLKWKEREGGVSLHCNVLLLLTVDIAHRVLLHRAALSCCRTTFISYRNMNYSTFYSFVNHIFLVNKFWNM